MNLTAVIALVASIVAFSLTQRILLGKPYSTRVTAVLILGVLSIPSLLCAVYYLHVIPEKSWFYSMRSWHGSEFFAVFLGAAGGACATFLPRYILMLPLFLTIVLASVPYLKPLLNPLDRSVLKEEWKDGACMQSTSSTCGPASVASVLAYEGVHSSEGEIASAAYTSASGTEAWYLARYLRGRGYIVGFDFRESFDSSVSFPALVGVKLGSAGHFIAVLEVKSDEVTFVDPLSGKRRLSTQEFRDAYRFTGFHMTVRKNRLSGS